MSFVYFTMEQITPNNHYLRIGISRVTCRADDVAKVMMQMAIAHPRRAMQVTTANRQQIVIDYQDNLAAFFNVEPTYTESPTTGWRYIFEFPRDAGHETSALLAMIAGLCIYYDPAICPSGAHRHSTSTYSATN